MKRRPRRRADRPWSTAAATASIVVGHPPELVWTYITDPDHTAHVLPGTLTTRAEKAPPYGVGDLWDGRARFFGMTYDWTGVFTQVETNRLMQFRSTESRFPFITTDTLDEVDGGTRYTCRAVGKPLVGGRAGRLLDVAMAKAYQRVLQRHLMELPGHIDAWAAGRR